LRAAGFVPDQLVFLSSSRWPHAADPQQRATLDAEIFRADPAVNSDVADQAIARASVGLAAPILCWPSSSGTHKRPRRTRDHLRIDIAAEFAKPDDERNAGLRRSLRRV